MGIGNQYRDRAAADNLLVCIWNVIKMGGYFIACVSVVVFVVAVNGVPSKKDVALPVAINDSPKFADENSPVKRGLLSWIMGDEQNPNDVWDHIGSLVAHGAKSLFSDEAQSLDEPGKEHLRKVIIQKIKKGMMKAILKKAAEKSVNHDEQDIWDHVGALAGHGAKWLWNKLGDEQGNDEEKREIQDAMFGDENSPEKRGILSWILGDEQNNDVWDHIGSLVAHGAKSLFSDEAQSLDEPAKEHLRKVIIQKIKKGMMKALLKKPGTHVV